MKKMLIVYYSLSNGNTERIAKKLQVQTGADIVKLDTVIPYPDDYQTVVNQGQEEVNRGYQPELRPIDVNIRDYDVVAVGTPTWWYTMAPAVLSFLKGQDWSGITIIPFMTSGGWPGHVIKDMTDACKGAKVVCPAKIQFDSSGGAHLETPQREIDAWIEAVKKICKEN